MWLIDTTTLQLCWRIEPQLGPPYAILSHTWGDDEVTFADMQNRRVAEKKEGWHKIEQTCRLARSEGYGYAWVDTCCIDKSSSAELSEAINSMFEWYSLARVCYAWMEDWVGSKQEELANCRWFSRGWTLQELIAPSSLRFYDRGWVCRGSKESLHMLIHKTTKVDVGVLLGTQQLSSVPIGRRMSWAAHRQTTRQEDAAYSLLGIFGVNLPMIYGEGGVRAFLRLQEEIARSSPDLTLFAWTPPESGPDKQEFWGMLASGPRDFADCFDLILLKTQFRQDGGFVITNRGLEVPTNRLVITRQLGFLLPVVGLDPDMFYPPGLALWCQKASEGGRMLLVPLARMHSGFVRCGFGRLRSHVLPSGPSVAAHDSMHVTSLLYNRNATAEEYFGLYPAKTVHVSKYLTPSSLQEVNESRRRVFRVGLPDVVNRPDYEVHGYPHHLWDLGRRLFYMGDEDGFVGLIVIKKKVKGMARLAELPIACGFEKSLGGPWACVLPPAGHNDNGKRLAAASAWYATTLMTGADDRGAYDTWQLMDEMRRLGR